MFISEEVAKHVAILKKKNNKTEVRRKAARALGAIGDIEAVEPLLEVLHVAQNRNKTLYRSVYNALEKILQQNKDQAMPPICWLCKQKPSDSQGVWSQPLYRIVSSKTLLHGTVLGSGDDLVETAWEYRTVFVPRCNRCKWSPLITGVAGALTGCTIALIVSIILALSITGYSILIASLGSFGAIIGLTIISNKRSAITEYPIIKALLATGWNLGKRPPGVKANQNMLLDGNAFLVDGRCIFNPPPICKQHYPK